ncbi:MAG: hypothetical protein ACM3OC_01860 [Deltaproteobacteria bacterium]
MRSQNMILMFAAAVMTAGCSGQFWGGAATGALGAGAAYEATGQQQLRELNKEKDEGKITQQEYDLRKKQIEQGHLIK